MIQEAAQRTVMISNPLAKASYHIDEGALGHITSMLSNMYSEPELACLREYYSNAVDSHIQVGTKRAVDVGLPTSLEPVFNIRDYGPGLSVEDTNRLLGGYGSSGEHKRKSNDYVGGFGIGAKVAFAVCKAFTYTIYHGGMKRVWQCYLDDMDRGQQALQFEEPSDEPTGIDVSLTVPSARVQAFTMAAETAFKYYTFTPPNFIRGTPDELELPDPEERSGIVQVALGSGVPPVKLVVASRGGALASNNISEYHYRSEDWAVPIVVGYAPYSLDLSKLTALDKSTQVKLFELLRNVVELRLPIGFLQLAPSREAIQYSQRTVTLMTALLNWFAGDAAMTAVTTTMYPRDTDSIADAKALFRLVATWGAVAETNMGSSRTTLNVTAAARKLAASEVSKRQSPGMRKYVRAGNKGPELTFPGVAAVASRNILATEESVHYGIPVLQGAGAGGNELPSAFADDEESRNGGWPLNGMGDKTRVYAVSPTEVSAEHMHRLLAGFILARKDELRGFKVTLVSLTVPDDAARLQLEESIARCPLLTPCVGGRPGAYHIPLEEQAALADSGRQAIYDSRVMVYTRFSSRAHRAARSSGRSYASRNKIASHSRKFLMPVGGDSTSRGLGKLWGPAVAKDVAAAKAVVYMPLKEFLLLHTDNNTWGWSGHVAEWGEFLQGFPRRGDYRGMFDDRLVVGIRATDVPSIEKEDNFESVWSWIPKRMNVLRAAHKGFDDAVFYGMMLDTEVGYSVAGPRAVELFHMFELVVDNGIRRLSWHKDAVRWNTARLLHDTEPAIRGVAQFLRDLIGLAGNSVLRLMGDTPEALFGSSMHADSCLRKTGGCSNIFDGPGSGNRDSKSNEMGVLWRRILDEYPLLLALLEKINPMTTSGCVGTAAYAESSLGGLLRETRDGMLVECLQKMSTVEKLKQKEKGEVKI